MVYPFHLLLNFYFLLGINIKPHYFRPPAHKGSTSPGWWEIPILLTFHLHPLTHPKQEVVRYHLAKKTCWSRKDLNCEDSLTLMTIQ